MRLDNQIHLLRQQKSDVQDELDSANQRIIELINAHRWKDILLMQLIDQIIGAEKVVAI